MKLPKLQFGKAQRPPGSQDGDDDDVEAIIFHNLWVHHRLLPPRSKKRAYWDTVSMKPLSPLNTFSSADS